MKKVREDIQYMSDVEGLMGSGGLRASWKDGVKKA